MTKFENKKSLWILLAVVVILTIITSVIVITVIGSTPKITGNVVTFSTVTGRTYTLYTKQEVDSLISSLRGNLENVISNIQENLRNRAVYHGTCEQMDKRIIKVGVIVNGYARDMTKGEFEYNLNSYLPEGSSINGDKLCKNKDYTSPEKNKCFGVLATISYYGNNSVFNYNSVRNIYPMVGYSQYFLNCNSPISTQLSTLVLTSDLEVPKRRMDVTIKPICCS
ncbi:MAG: hypothetical protein QXJ28_01240 [Candidatus Pacearchaeota archaeon]